MGTAVDSQAGNPDRQGEAGAYELLMVPYARTAGLHLMNTAFISGVESIRLNVAGLARINKTEITLGSTQYLKGTGITMSGTIIVLTKVVRRLGAGLKDNEKTLQVRPKTCLRIKCSMSSEEASGVGQRKPKATLGQSITRLGAALASGRIRHLSSTYSSTPRPSRT